MPERMLFYRGLFRALMQVQLLMLALFLLVIVVLYSGWQRSYQQEVFNRNKEVQQVQLRTLQKELEHLRDYFIFFASLWQESLQDDAMQTLAYILLIEDNIPLELVQIHSQGTAYRFVREAQWKTYIAPESLLLGAPLKAALKAALLETPQAAQEGWLVFEGGLYYVYQEAALLLYARFDLQQLVAPFFVKAGVSIQVYHYLFTMPQAPGAGQAISQAMHGSSQAMLCGKKSPGFIAQAFLETGRGLPAFAKDTFYSYRMLPSSAHPCPALLSILSLPLASAAFPLDQANLAQLPLLWLWQDLRQKNLGASGYVHLLIGLVLLVMLVGMLFSVRVLQTYFVVPMQNVLQRLSALQASFPSRETSGNTLDPKQLRDIFTRLDQAFLDLSQSFHEVKSCTAMGENAAEANFSLSDLYSKNQQIQLRWLQAEKLSALGQMMAGIAHEMNTPLGYIGSNVVFLQGVINEVRWLQDMLKPLLANVEAKHPELLAQWQVPLGSFHREALDGAFIAELEQVLDDTLYGIDQLFSIIEGLKVYSRKEGISNVPVNLSQVVAGALKIAKAAVGQHQLTADLAEGLPVFLSSPNELTQICINLVTNAVQAISHDHGKIEVRVFQEGSALVLAVQDNGSGIPKDLREKIFEPFFTTKPIGEGTGLGLAVTQQLVHKYGGKIRLASEEGVGSTFSVYFPLSAL